MDELVVVEANCATGAVDARAATAEEVERRRGDDARRRSRARTAAAADRRRQTDLATARDEAAPLEARFAALVRALGDRLGEEAPG